MKIEIFTHSTDVPLVCSLVKRLPDIADISVSIKSDDSQKKLDKKFLAVLAAKKSFFPHP